MSIYLDVSIDFKSDVTAQKSSKAFLLDLDRILAGREERDYEFSLAIGCHHPRFSGVVVGCADDGVWYDCAGRVVHCAMNGSGCLRKKIKRTGECRETIHPE